MLVILKDCIMTVFDNKREENPDEIVLENVKMFHLESMNEQSLWVGCYTQSLILVLEPLGAI
jgi:hypothetical protein